MAATTAAASSVYLLPLTDDGGPDVPGTHQYIYLPPPTEPAYVLRISIQGTSSICREGSFWINHPSQGEKFDRQRFREYKLKPDFNKPIEIDIPIVTAGAFAFYTTYTPLPEFSTEPIKTPPIATRTQTFYIDVSPRLSLQKQVLPLDALAIISCLSKFMGDDLSEWDKHLNGLSQKGYNMVHFTPLMVRGESNSPYSIYDQLTFDTKYFPRGEKDLASLVSKMEDRFQLLGLTDVVWNHTANNSKWLESHPEAGYNLLTAPWLESAIALDDALLKFGSELDRLGYPTTIESQDDLSKLREGMKTDVISTRVRLWEFYVLDVKRDTQACLQSWLQTNDTVLSKGDGSQKQGATLAQAQSWSLKQKADWVIDHALSGNDRMGERFRRRIVPDIASGLMSAIYGTASQSSSKEHQVLEGLQSILNEVNLQFYREYDQDCATILEQLSNRIKYMRLDEHGPRLGKISSTSPLIESYFTRLPLNETTKKYDTKALALANNGWIWAADALRDNAGPSSRAYLRREVIVWGDCVKLRYGSGPQDSPFLWDYMAEYTRLMAKYFAAFRIDNCHSTPMHVAEYMLDQARQVRPNLAVFAELFSGSESTDFVFVKKLGISALIREAMQAWTTQEMSRLVHIHGGIPIGSFDADEVSTREGGPKIHRLRASNVHALFFDCTHDNEPPAQRRDARDTLPNAALVSMCSCATGSVVGYDEIYPRLIELVHETRKYTSKASELKDGEDVGSLTEGGIHGVRKLLNQIHTLMGKDGYDETYIDHKDQYITVHRVHPKSRKGYFLIAHTAYPGYGKAGLAPVHLAGTKAKLIGAWTLQVDTNEQVVRTIENDKAQLKGLPSKVQKLDGLRNDYDGQNTDLAIPDDFPPGSIAVFETTVPSAEHSQGLDDFIVSGAQQAFSELKLRDLNFVLYRCDPEERDTSSGHDGVYSIPDHGSLVYAGLQGWWSVLRDVIKNNDLGHPICNHLRQGPWAMDYCVARLEKLSQMDGYGRLAVPAKWMRERFDAIKKLPNFLVPRYFARVLQTAYNAACGRAVEQMSDTIRNGPEFLKSLALVSVQMSGYMNSASLYPQHTVPCLAAGLPHFASDWARCWGRDVFISARGLLLGTGRFTNAREHILAFGSVLKHGMIPNLLSSGKVTRYNSRDSIWFFLQTIQDYTQMAPNGTSIFKDTVKRRFLPYDDTWFPWDDERAYSKTSTVEDIIQEALQRHAFGLSFREANAGPGIDSQMKDAGFQIDIHTDWSTGLVFGGSQFNCGTWMDKMGESERAGSKGVPGTPRDGAAVEITGLLYSTVAWLASLHERGLYAYEGVYKEESKKPDTFISFRNWANKIKESFERCYYVPRNPAQDAEYDVNSKIVNRRGIYKDLYRSGKEYEDYQLRPNFAIAMTVAPQLFDRDRALYAISIADVALRGPQGMATLDPSDLNYHPNYINSEDSTNFSTSKGRNYHQGPEWVWPTGFFLRAFLKFDLLRRKTPEERVESFQQVTKRLFGCMEMIKSSPWAGLAELTNQNGSFCEDSCPTQAWSAGCLIDLYHDAQLLSSS